MAIKLREYDTYVYAGGETEWMRGTTDLSQIGVMDEASRNRKASEEAARRAAKEKSSQDYFKFVEQQSGDVDASDIKASKDAETELYKSAAEKAAAGVNLSSDPDLMNKTRTYLDLRGASRQRTDLRNDVSSEPLPDFYKPAYKGKEIESINNTELTAIGGWKAPPVTKDDFATLDYLNSLVKELKFEKKSGSKVLKNSSQFGEMIQDWTKITNLPDDKVEGFADLAYENNDGFAAVANYEGNLDLQDYRAEQISSGRTEEDIDTELKTTYVKYNGEDVTMEEMFTKNAVEKLINPLVRSQKLVKQRTGKSEPKGTGATEEDALLRKKVMAKEIQTGKVPNVFVGAKSGNMYVVTSEWDSTKGGYKLTYGDKNKTKEFVEAKDFKRLNNLYGTLPNQKHVSDELLSKIPAVKTQSPAVEDKELIMEDVNTILTSYITKGEENYKKGNLDKAKTILKNIPGVTDVNYEVDKNIFTKDALTGVVNLKIHEKNVKLDLKDSENMKRFLFKYNKPHYMKKPKKEGELSNAEIASQYNLD